MRFPQSLLTIVLCLAFVLLGVALTLGLLAIRSFYHGDPLLKWALVLFASLLFASLVLFVPTVPSRPRPDQDG